MLMNTTLESYWQYHKTTARIQQQKQQEVPRRIPELELLIYKWLSAQIYIYINTQLYLMYIN